jgi:hypothetical protein
LHNDAELVARLTLQRLVVTENGVAAIYREMEFVAGFTEAFGDLLPRPGRDKIDVRNRVRTCPEIIESTFERVKYRFTTVQSYHMLWW